MQPDVHDAREYRVAYLSHQPALRVQPIRVCLIPLDDGTFIRERDAGA